MLLDEILKAGLDAPYSCQGGICSSCVAKITEGKATMVKNQILTDEEVEEGLILTCQAKCESEQISIDYDDV
jgi:ring-1,2-phenylacetyl-CoA epoxidase subunit PaaE